MILSHCPNLIADVLGKRYEIEVRIYIYIFKFIIEYSMNQVHEFWIRISSLPWSYSATNIGNFKTAVVNENGTVKRRPSRPNNNWPHYQNFFGVRSWIFFWTVSEWSFSPGPSGIRREYGNIARQIFWKYVSTLEYKYNEMMNNSMKLPMVFLPEWFIKK